jgi:hypothetical protein
VDREERENGPESAEDRDIETGDHSDAPGPHGTGEVYPRGDRPEEDDSEGDDSEEDG